MAGEEVGGNGTMTGRRARRAESGEGPSGGARSRYQGSKRVEEARGQPVRIAYKRLPAVALCE